MSVSEIKAAPAVKFSEIMVAYTRAATAGDGAFGKLMLFAMTVLDSEAVGKLTPENKSKALEEVLKNGEKEHKQASKDASMPGAYRSGKSVVCKAVHLGVSLTDEKGKPKGKTQLEKECKLAETPKPVLDKFRATMQASFSLLNQIDNTADLAAAKLLIAQLAEQCIKIEAAAASGASIGQPPAAEKKAA